MLQVEKVEKKVEGRQSQPKYSKDYVLCIVNDLWSDCNAVKNGKVIEWINSAGRYYVVDASKFAKAHNLGRVEVYWWSKIFCRCRYAQQIFREVVVLPQEVIMDHYEKDANGDYIRNPTSQHAVIGVRVALKDKGKRRALIQHVDWVIHPALLKHSLHVFQSTVEKLSIEIENWSQAKLWPKYRERFHPNSPKWKPGSLAAVDEIIEYFLPQMNPHIIRRHIRK